MAGIGGPRGVADFDAVSTDGDPTPDDDDLAAIEEIVREKLRPGAADRLLALVRPSVGMAVVAGEEAGHWYGGPPQGTAGFDWPRYGDTPMVLLAQFDCRGMAALFGGDWPLPEDGHLLYFHDEEFAARQGHSGSGDDGCRVLHVPSGRAGQRPPGDGKLIPLQSLASWASPSLPAPTDDAADEAVGDLDGLLALFEIHRALDDEGLVPRHRLLGWCDSGALPPEGARNDTTPLRGHRPLLRLEAEQGTAWGEVVNVSFWIRDEDLRAGKLDTVRRSYDAG